MSDRPATKGDIDALKEDLVKLIDGLSNKVEGISKAVYEVKQTNATQQIEINQLKIEVKNIKYIAFALTMTVVGLIGKALLEFFMLGKG